MQRQYKPSSIRFTLIGEVQLVLCKKFSPKKDECTDGIFVKCEINITFV